MHCLSQLVNQTSKINLYAQICKMVHGSHFGFSGLSKLAGQISVTEKKLGLSNLESITDT